jgi:hypothetical protein
MTLAQELASSSGGSGGGRARGRRAWKKVMTWPQQGQRISALSGRRSTTSPARRSWRTRTGEMASAGENSRPGCPARHPAGCRSVGNSKHRSFHPCRGFLPWHRHRVGHPAGQAGRLFSPHAAAPARTAAQRRQAAKQAQLRRGGTEGINPRGNPWGAHAPRVSSFAPRGRLAPFREAANGSLRDGDESQGKNLRNASAQQVDRRRVLR